MPGADETDPAADIDRLDAIMVGHRQRIQGGRPVHRLALAESELARRLRRNADRLREIADTHDATAHEAEAVA